MSNRLSQVVLEKISEQAERTAHLLDFVPAGRLDWCPGEGGSAMTLGELLGHLLECLAGFCAALYALHGDRLAHFAKLRELPVNHRCSVDEARARLREYLKRIEEGFALMSDDDLARQVPTLFSPQGQPALKLFLNNLEHLASHKEQLFIYLKLLGAPVGTADLY